MKKLFLATLLMMAVGVSRGQGNLYDLSVYEKKGYPEGLSAYIAQSEEGDVLLSIFEGTRMSQLINVGYVDVNTYGDANVKVVHFLDVNYDGYPDILVGKDGPRCGLASVIYNPQTKKYDYETDGVILQSPLFDPANNVIYSHGAGSAAQYFITRVFPSGQRLLTDRSLRITSDLAGYNANTDPQFRAAHKYDIVNAEGKYLNEGWNDRMKLPAEWQRLLKATGLEE